MQMHRRLSPCLSTLFFSPFYSMTRRRPISHHLAFVLRFNIAIGRNNGPIASHQIRATTIQFLRTEFSVCIFVAAQVSFANPLRRRAAVTVIYTYRAEVGIRQCWFFFFFIWIFIFLTTFLRFPFLSHNAPISRLANTTNTGPSMRQSSSASRRYKSKKGLLTRIHCAAIATF